MWMLVVITGTLHVYVTTSHKVASVPDPALNDAPGHLPKNTVKLCEKVLRKGHRPHRKSTPPASRPGPRPWLPGV